MHKQGREGPSGKGLLEPDRTIRRPPSCRGQWTGPQDSEGTRHPRPLEEDLRRPREGGRLLTLVTFLLMFSRSCSWPRRKQGCWNSVSSLSGLTKPPCSMWTTFRKPSAHGGVGAALPQAWGPDPRRQPGPCPSEGPRERPRGGLCLARLWSQHSPQPPAGLGLRETSHPQATHPPHHLASRFPEDSGFRPAGRRPLRAVMRAPPFPGREPGARVLTHVELAHEAGHVVVLEVLG